MAALDTFEAQLISFSASLEEEDTLREVRYGDKDDEAVQSLLRYYRNRCDTFDKDQKQIVQKLKDMEVSCNELHHLQWQLKRKDKEINGYDERLRSMQDQMHQNMRDIEALKSENNALAFREAQESNKMQHLLNVTQSIINQVPYINCDVETSDAPFATYSYPSSHFIGSNNGRQKILKRNAKPSIKSHSPHRGIDLKKVLEALYTPQEKTHMKADQSERHLLIIAEERVQSVLDDLLTKTTNWKVQQNDYEREIDILRNQLDKTRRILHSTTRDYLVLRHQSQISQRLAFEQVNSLTTQNKVLQAQFQDTSTRSSVALSDAPSVKSLRLQAATQAKELLVLKEQYYTAQDTHKQQVHELETRLNSLRTRYRNLSSRRRMELEGFSHDIANMKRDIQKIETLFYENVTTMRDKKLARFEDHAVLNSDELHEEINALKRRFTKLAEEIVEETERDV